MREHVNPKPKRFEVWYAKSYHPCYPPFLDMEKLIPTYEQLINHYSKIREVDIDCSADKACEIIFHDMNMGTWNQDGHQETIKDTGIRHTSMSVGDLIRDRKTGKWYQCASWGFKEFEMGAEESNYIGPPENHTTFPCSTCDRTIEERYENPDCNKTCETLKKYWDEVL